MKRFASLVAALAVFACIASAQPAVSGVLNNYSFALPGTPSYVFAQGSIIQIYTRNAGPAQLVSQTYPLSRTLSGVSINVTVGGTTVQAIPYYVSAGLIAAILPSATPVGAGKISITFNGQTSPQFDIAVVASAVGILTLNQAGSGAAAVLDGNYQYITSNHAANPGEFVSFWGTGSGAAAGDETIYPFPQVNLTNAFEATIGGAIAEVAYHGRSQFPGLDQYVVKIPAGVSGCNVPVVFRTGNYVSNFVTIPVASSGRVCSDANGFSAGDIQTLNSRGSLNIGSITVGKGTFTTPGITIPGVGTVGGSTVTTDIASAAFFRFTLAQFNNPSSNPFQQPSINGCVVSTLQAQGDTIPTPPSPPTPLNAGASITMSGPNALSRAMARDAQSGVYFTNGGVGGSALFIPANGGTFSFTNGSGGPDVGTLNNAQITLGAPIVWSNADSVNVIPRNQGLVINWTGGEPGSSVSISGGGFGGTETARVYASFTCRAATDAHTFTIPAAVLLSMPATQATQGIVIPTGTITVDNYSNPKPFTANGLDYAVLLGYSSSGKSVSFQ